MDRLLCCYCLSEDRITWEPGNMIQGSKDAVLHYLPTYLPTYLHPNYTWQTDTINIHIGMKGIILNAGGLLTARNTSMSVLLTIYLVNLVDQSLQLVIAQFFLCSFSLLPFPSLPFHPPLSLFCQHGWSWCVAACNLVPLLSYCPSWWITLVLACSLLQSSNFPICCCCCCCCSCCYLGTLLLLLPLAVWHWAGPGKHS